MTATGLSGSNRNEQSRIWRTAIDYLDRPLRDSLAILLGSSEATPEKWDEFSVIASSMEIAILLVAQVEPGNFVTFKSGGDLEILRKFKATETEPWDLSCIIGQEFVASLDEESVVHNGNDRKLALNTAIFDTTGCEFAVSLIGVRTRSQSANDILYVVAIKRKAVNRNL